MRLPTGEQLVGAFIALACLVALVFAILNLAAGDGQGAFLWAIAGAVVAAVYVFMTRTPR